MINTRELRQKNDRELIDLLQDWRQKLSALSLKAAAKQLKDVRDIRSVKRDIARCLTVMRERRGH